jgi:hypothetical protein
MEGRMNKKQFYTMRYAIDGEGRRYRIFPVYQSDALVTLIAEDTYGNETGERKRIPMSDLYEFYTLLDMDEKEIP